jgi:uncharacterized protein YegL
MYELKWNSATPGHIVFLIDLSGSMSENKKIDYLMDALKDTLEILLAYTEGKERVEISIYGYNFQVVEIWKNKKVSEIVQIFSEAEEKGNKLFNLRPEYQTCMRLAFERAKLDIEEWLSIQKIKGNLNTPSPIVINITDGFPYEGPKFNQDNVYADTLKAAKDIMSISTSDGNVRLFNIHFDPQTEEPTLRFPSSEPNSKNLQFLYNASSVMTSQMVSAAKTYGFAETKEGSRALVSNEKDAYKLARFLQWGTTV